MSRRRVTDADVERRLADVKEHGLQLDIEGAEYWQVGNPFGPTGLHFLEVHHDDGGWTSQSTKLGHHTWQTKREAYDALSVMAQALHAARRATESGDRFSDIHQAGTV